MRRSGRSKRGKGKGAAQAAGGLPTTARLLGPSAPKCPKAEIPMGRVPPVPDNRRFPRETPNAISSRRQTRLLGFDSMPRNHAEKWESTGLPPADSLAPLPERAARNRAKAACFGRDTARGRESPRPLSRFMSACYRASARFHASTRYSSSSRFHVSTRYSSSSRCHASARYRASSRFRAQALRRTSAPRQRRLQATRPWCPSGRPRTPCPSTKHQSYPA